MAELSNETLATRAAAGDSAALAELYEQNQGLIYQICRPLVTSKTPIDDLMQQAFLCLARIVTTWKPEKGFRFSSYLSRSLFGMLHRWRKNTELSMETTTLNAPPPFFDDGEDERLDHLPCEEEGYEIIEDDMWAAALRQDLEAAMSSALSDRERQVIRLRYWGGLSLKETAVQLDMSSFQTAAEIQNRSLRKPRRGSAGRRLRSYWREIESEYVPPTVEAQAIARADLSDRQSRNSERREFYKRALEQDRDS